MNKYDKMLALNKEASDEKIERAKRVIIEMMDNGEKVSIPRLMEKTGLSRGFFYKNPIVRKEIDRALELQVGMRDPRRSILDMAMNDEIRSLQKRNEALQRQVESLEQDKKNLEKENERLRNALGKQNFSKLKSLL